MEVEGLLSSGPIFIMLFIPRHFKKCVICYTLHSKNCVWVSVRLSVRTRPRYIMRFAICTAVFIEVRARLGLVQFGVIGLKWAFGVNLTRLTPSICNGQGPLETSEHPSCKYLCTSVRLSAYCFHSLLGAFFNQFSSNLLWELILGRSVLGLQVGKFWQISTELRPLDDVRNWFSLYFWHFFTGFLQTWYESRYCEGVFCDCRWVNFDK